MLCGIALLAIITTPIAWFAVLAMPDIFAGLAILCITLLTAMPERLGKVTRTIMACLIAFAVCAHLSHPPIIGGVVALSGLILALRYGIRDWRQIARSYAYIGPPAIVGVVVSLGINMVGFHEASVTGKRYPIVLASSIQAGPARWYLLKHCGEAKYTVCELYRDRPIPDTSGEFLFGVNGVRRLASPDQMERIRKEEPEILRRATAAYPLATVGQAAYASAWQFFRVGLEDHHIGDRLFIDRDGSFQPDYRHKANLLLKRSFRIIFLVEIITMVGAFGWLVAYQRNRLSRPQIEMLVLVMSGCVINAVICGAMSAVTDRYQGRVVWLGIIVVFLIAWEAYKASRPPCAADEEPSLSPAP